MKKIVTLLLAALLALPAMASDALLVYNPERSGEGAAIFIDEHLLVMTFYTFTDSIVTYPPTVSPSLPPPYVTLQCVNSPIWYLGVAGDWDGDTAIGTLYADRPFDYPLAVDDQVSASTVIGTFMIERDAEGFDFYVDWVENDVLPYTVSLYTSVYQLWLPLLKVKGE